ncbi:MAG TPA: tetratricopeptide repeat protein [Thermoanaerobaculia bacterium]|nr:tetratricopeptide repeat protein [Thermoanaerobaculia bacterium]
MSEIPFAVHNPALLPADVLLGEFTARRTLLTALLRIVRDNVRGKPQQHLVLVGSRGMGKTTTLWAVAHSISNDAELSRQWQPVVFDEESRRIGDLADFWLEAIRQWELATHSAEAEAERLLENAGDDLEEQARELFLNALDRSGKRAVLLIDNLNDVFASISDPAALHRLRAFLMEDDRVMIAGAATRHFDAITALDEPFFDFFRVFTLSPLTLEEMQATLLALAERRGDARVTETIDQRPGTIRSLHVLTGGNPRLIKTFYRLLAEGLRGDVRQDLERLVDEFTPYFKAILDGLSTQQQRIIDAVALAWEPVEVATIARATRLPSNQVSAQLRILVRSNIAAEAAAGSAKRKTYLLADRFSNIHYLMRHGRTAKRRFDWFVLTLRALFPDSEQADAIARVASRTALAGAEGMRDARDLVSSAVLRAESEDSRRRIVQATIRETWNQETVGKFDEWLDLEFVKQHLPSSAGELDIVAFLRQLPTELRISLNYRPEDAGWWLGLTSFLEEREAWLLAEGAYRQAVQLDPARTAAWIDLAALLLHHLGRPSEAESAARRAIELGANDARAWTVLGIALRRIDRPAEAEVALRTAIEVNPDQSEAWNSLGILLAKARRFEEAESAYRRSIALNSDNHRVRTNLANLLLRTGRLYETEAEYRAAIELAPQYAAAWNNLGVFLLRSNRYDHAEAAFRKAIESKEEHVEAWTNLGLVLGRQGRFVEAESANRRAISLGSKYPEPYSAVARILFDQGGEQAEARALALRGVMLEPTSVFAQNVFAEVCTDDAPSWQVALPTLAALVALHRDDTATFDFTINGFIRYAQLTSAAEAEKLLATIMDPLPFETLTDAFRAHADPTHLHRLAPERQALVIEILDRIAKTPKPKRKKRARKRAST